MNLDEITLTKKLQDVKPYETLNASGALKKILTSHGWRSLGTGAESAVAMHPAKAYVLKIFYEESKYQDFVAFVKQHQANPHLPKFSRYVRQVPGTPFMYVRMEKLQRVTESQLLGTYFPYLLAMDAMGQAHGVDMLSSDLADIVQDNVGDWGFDSTDLLDSEISPDIYERAGGYPPETWVDVLDELGEYSRSIDLNTWDMHQGNFMRRGSTLVIADPFY